MSLPRLTSGYSLGPDEGEALWFNGGLGILKATTALTEGRFAAIELRTLKDFASPLHVHRDEDEFFLVPSGEVRLRHGDTMIEAGAGSWSMGHATCRMRSAWIRMKRECSLSSRRPASKGSSARVASRPDHARSRPQARSSSIGRR